MNQDINMRLLSYLKLTKPTIMLLVGLTGASALVMEGSLLSRPFEFMLAMLGMLLAGGSANSFNQYFEREKDALMERTKTKRPLPLHQISPAQALTFSVFLGILAAAIFAHFFNWLSAFLSVGTILFYGLFYTLWLKPRTHVNIVIGGAAGAMAPVIAWAAASGSIGWVAVILFLVIFFWTPSHFWALAMCLKEDYRKVGLPMLPVVKGDKITANQILVYALWTVAISLTLIFSKVGAVYVLAAVSLGALFILKARKLQRMPEIKEAGRLFAYSITYLMLLFSALIVDTFIKVRI